MSDEQPRLGPHTEWLISVVAQAKMRPWISGRDGKNNRIDGYCTACGDTDEDGPIVHRRDCPFAALDAALDKEPQP